MANLLDLMTEDERNKMLAKFEERVATKESKSDNKIPNNIYLLAEFGYYFGWDAIMAVKNNEISYEEMYALLEGAKKVFYKKFSENADIMHKAFSSVISKSAGRAFRNTLNEYSERANNGE